MAICRCIKRITNYRSKAISELGSIVKGGAYHVLALGRISFEEISFLLGLFLLGGWRCLPFRVGILILDMENRMSCFIMSDMASLPHFVYPRQSDRRKTVIDRSTIPACRLPAIRNSRGQGELSRVLYFLKLTCLFSSQIFHGKASLRVLICYRVRFARDWH